MKKQMACGLLALLAMSLLGACNNKPSEEAPSSETQSSEIEVASSKESSSLLSSKESSSSKSSKEKSSSVDEGPKKEVTDLSISLGNDGNKAYITVRGKQANYTADEFKWAWGLKANDGTFADGKANPTDEDYKKVDFNNNNEFTVKYCLTDIQTIKSGVLYRIYGGTPETYGDIQFASNQFGASDATRKYYLRNDENNSLVFDSIQPISFTKASVVEIAEADLPTGVTTSGAYLKVGGANSKGLTMDTINSWHEAGNIAGNFQRVIPAESYAIHTHVDEERFWAIEGNDVFFYLYVGFLADGEGWMTHFDLVGGNEGGNFQLDATLNGETAYTVGEATYKVYADKNKGGEENYWGCLGVYRGA